MTVSNSVRGYNTESWSRVSSIVDLAEIFNPDMQVCSWQRTIDAPLTAYLDKISGSTIQIREMLTKDSRARLADLPAGEGKELLRNDVTMLKEILCELVDCSSVGLRYASINNAMCPRWHVDRVPIRMLCTYAGAGTEWIENQRVDRRGLLNQEFVNDPLQQAASGEVVLLKGALWQGNDGSGAIHRSPAIAVGEQQRMLLTLGPLWSD